MAELVDALVSEASEETHGGSSPLGHTNSINMQKTVCCYLKKDDCYLLLFRNKKSHDVNHNKWIGVGGHVEEGETIDQAVIREIKEETGLDVHRCSCAGEVEFVYDGYHEMMYIYEITDFSGTQIVCNEGELAWIPIKDIYQYPMWEGDKVFLPLLIEHKPYFKLSLIYKNDVLVNTIFH